MSKNRDRVGKTVQFEARSREEVLKAISSLLDTEEQARIAFQRNGEAYSLNATSGIEPTS